MNEQISTLSVSLTDYAFPVDLIQPFASGLSIKTRATMVQFSDVERLATLTQLYLELNLPFKDALRAAEADL